MLGKPAAPDPAKLKSLENVLQKLFLSSIQYSVQQKHCPATLDEKGLFFFFKVNFHEIVHANTYTL